MIIDSPLRDGSLRSEAEKLGIPVLTYEGGEALRFDHLAIRAGYLGIHQVMKEIGMLRPNRKKLPEPVLSKSTSWIRAESDGILRNMVRLGEQVEAGQTLAYISSPLGHQESQVITTKGGIVIGQQTLPLVNEGDAVFHIAYFKQDDEEVGQTVESYIEEVAEDDWLTTLNN